MVFYCASILCSLRGQNLSQQPSNLRSVLRPLTYTRSLSAKSCDPAEYKYLWSLDSKFWAISRTFMYLRKLTKEIRLWAGMQICRSGKLGWTFSRRGSHNSFLPKLTANHLHFLSFSLSLSVGKSRECFQSETRLFIGDTRPELVPNGAMKGAQ